MKKLELNQMENVQGGWSWEGCAVGAMTTTLAAGGYAAALGGPWGVLALAVVGCVVQGAA